MNSKRSVEFPQGEFTSPEDLKMSGVPGRRKPAGATHAMDDIRYFAATVAAKNGGSFFAGSVERDSI